MNIEVDVSNVVLKTERLMLRPFRLDDLNDFFEYASVDGVGEMAGWPHHENNDESLRILETFILEKKTFAIVKDKKVIGSIGIEMYNPEYFPEIEKYRARELGFVLSKDYWGQGIMREALEAVIDYCFNTCNMEVLACRHNIHNNNSKRVQEKVGFFHIKKISVYSNLMQKREDDWCSLLFKNPNLNIALNKMIAYCGLDCSKCGARIATVNKNESLKEDVAKKWSELNKIEITKEMINCDGCRLDGNKTPFCDYLCEIKKCASSKHYSTCQDCIDLDNCEKIKMIIGNNLEACDRLHSKK